MSITPVAVGDSAHYASLDNLLNCVSYKTLKDDVVMVHIYSGGSISSQKLNLQVFDLANNVLRSIQDLSGEQVVMFTNLNNPIQFPQMESHNLLGLGNQKKARNAQSELDALEQGKSYVHICFDNVYYDKSWSFQKSNRDIHLNVNIRNITTLRNTNYNNYAKYFTDVAGMPAAEDSKNDLKNHDFTEKDFDFAVNRLELQLNEVSEELKASYQILGTLKKTEQELRNANEAIYDSYTRTFLLIIVSICIFGSLELCYFYTFFRRRNLI